MKFLKALVIILGFQGAAQADEYISLRGTPGLSNATIEYIARNSEPKVGYINIGELPERFIKQVCGHVTNTFSSLFFGTYNTKLVREPAQVRRSAVIPACAKWRREDSGDGVAVGVFVGDTLDSVLLRKIGRKANQIQKCSPDDSATPRCGLTYRELVENLNKGLDLANLKPGSTIRLPFVTEITTFPVKRGSSVTALEHIAKIKELAGFADPDSPLIEIEVPPAISLINPVDADGQTCPAASPDTAGPWPYDDQAVAGVIKRTLSLAEQSYPATLTVIDTGLDASFPSGLLRRNDFTNANSPYGIGVFRLDNIRPYSDHTPNEVRLHGTEVARIAAGFPKLQKAYPQLSALFKLNVVNVMEPPAGGGGGYGITSGGLVKALEWFVTHGDIVNLSIASKDQLPGILNAIKRNAQSLVVSAAGNESAELNLTDWYPANYGGRNEESGTQFITVAAIDATLSPTGFTNKGGRYVDLFAPGCDVPYDQTASGVTGTSFAAPLVSLTASLLRSFGLRTPKDIKRRLQASVDYDGRLEDLAAWSGRLNISKALSLYDDVLQLRSRPLEFGQWTAPSDICKDTVILPTIRKITVKNKAGALVLRVLWSDSQEQLQETECEPSSDKLVLDGRPDPIVWSDLIDYVPRLFRKN